MKTICTLLLTTLSAFSALYQVNVGTSPNDRTGDPARQAFIKINANAVTLDTFITAVNATNATQTAALSALQSKQFVSITLSNLARMGITNIIAGANVTLTTNSGNLVIAFSGTGATNNIPVLQGGVLDFDIIEADLFFIGLLIPTNTVYVATTNTAVSNGTNFVADFSRSEQILIVTNSVRFIHGTNLWGAPTNAYLTVTLPNFSGSNQTLDVPSTWRKQVGFPAIITNATVVELKLHNYGLAQSNILAGAIQY